MITLLLCCATGAMSGWVGSIANRTDNKQEDETSRFVIVGVVGGLIGGIVPRFMGLLPQSTTSIDSMGIFNALLFSAIFVACYAVFTHAVRKKSSQ